MRYGRSRSPLTPGNPHVLQTGRLPATGHPYQGVRVRTSLSQPGTEVVRERAGLLAHRGDLRLESVCRAAHGAATGRQHARADHLHGRATATGPPGGNRKVTDPKRVPRARTTPGKGAYSGRGDRRDRGTRPPAPPGTCRIAHHGRPRARIRPISPDQLPDHSLRCAGGDCRLPSPAPTTPTTPFRLGPCTTTCAGTTPTPRDPDVLAAQRRERARIRCEKGIRWGRCPVVGTA